MVVSFGCSGVPSRVFVSGSFRETPGSRMKAVVTMRMMTRVRAMSMSGMKFISAIGSSSGARVPWILRLLPGGLPALSRQQRDQARDVSLHVEQQALDAARKVVVGDHAGHRDE